jgi:hypothetical protein
LKPEPGVQIFKLNDEFYVLIYFRFFTEYIIITECCKFGTGDAFLGKQSIAMQAMILKEEGNLRREVESCLN